ncbi:MAG TPA: ATP-dependent helicase [Herpetosiphonaceae bacterium]
MPLNPQQQTAAQAAHDAPLKIIAGAGTGKTETLAGRYVQLVRQGITPERIVLLTFTEDAAAEMRARVMLRLHEAGLILPPHRLLHLWIATFHGFAMRLLHEYGFEVGLPPTPRLLSEDDQQEIWQTIREAVEAEPQLGAGYVPLDHSAYRWDTDETWHKVMAVVTALRRGGGTTDELEPHPQLYAQQTSTFAAHRAQLVPLIEHCFSAYTGSLQRRGVLDFDELLQAALRLLRATPTIRSRFDVVMIDEFQDTNRPQLALLEQLQPAFARTTVVGDPRQAIYGWNSARAESIYRFPFTGSGNEHSLSENYRSDPAIVAIANAALHGSELGSLAELSPSSDRRARTHPALAAEPVVSLHLVPGVADEAVVIAAEIRRLHERGVAYRDMAVLLRSRTNLTALMDALHAAGVPFEISGGSGFYLHWAVRSTASLLRLLADPADRPALAHVLESPLIGIPPHLLALQDPAHASADTAARQPAFVAWLDDPTAVPADVPERAAIVERLETFGRFFGSARSRRGLLQPAPYLEWLWQASGLLRHLAATNDLQAQLTLQQLLRDADDYTAAHPADGIAGFTALLRQRVQTQPRVALPTAPSLDAVEIATVHQAKGREWPVVWIFNTALPSRRAGQVDSVLWDEQWKLVIGDSSTARSGSTRGDADPLTLLRDDLRRRKRNEERSIWYVALTRAQERLYILHSGCPLDGTSFADATEKLARQAEGAAPGKQDEAVHFFHELWQHVQRQGDSPSARIVCLPPAEPLKDESTQP